MTSSTAPVPAPSTSARRVHIAGLGAGAVQVVRAMAYAPYMPLMAAQVDTVRLLSVGQVRSVRAMTGKWFPGRWCWRSGNRPASTERSCCRTSVTCTSPPDGVDTDVVLAHHGGDL